LSETFFGPTIRAGGLKTLEQLIAHNFSRAMPLRIRWRGAAKRPVFVRHALWRGGFNPVGRDVNGAGKMAGVEFARRATSITNAPFFSCAAALRAEIRPAVEMVRKPASVFYGMKDPLTPKICELVRAQVAADDTRQVCFAAPADFVKLELDWKTYAALAFHRGGWNLYRRGGSRSAGRADKN
jgi:hypothetical protein